MINRVTIVGRITRDPELRSSVNDKKFVAFTVVVNNLNNNPDYISCFAWNKTAENMVKFLKKGAMVGVDGAIQSRRVERNGVNVTDLFVTANRVAFLEPRRSSGADTTANPSPSDTAETVAERINDDTVDDGISWK